jgi:putative ABC transport system substrate-binding protein
MRRREFIPLLGAAAATWPLAARAQQPAIPVIGFLHPGTPEGSVNVVAGFRKGLSEAGFVEGHNLDIEYRWAQDHDDRLPALAADLVRLKPSVIVAEASSTALVLKRATAELPIVVPTMADPVRLGLVASEARPGGNVTGILVNLEGLPGKQLQLAAELVPGATKIGFLLNLNNPGMTFQRPDVEKVASALRLNLVTESVRMPDDLEAAFRRFASEQVASVMVGQDGMFLRQRERIAALASAARLPVVSGGREFAEAGAVVTYGVDARESWRRAAVYVDKILKGTKAGDLPVELPTKVMTFVNLKSAKALGLTVAPALLGHADEVIE